jgi:hypothetical protein
MKQSIFARYSLRTIRERLNDEVYLKLLADSTGEPDAIKVQKLRLPYYHSLMQINHQRVSACISHASLMLAALLISYNIILAPKPNEITEHHYAREIIGGEVIFYLVLAILLIRCLKDFGLDSSYGRDEQALESYCGELLAELSYRYFILDLCNKSLRIGAGVFAFILALHFFATR